MNCAAFFRHGRALGCLLIVAYALVSAHAQLEKQLASLKKLHEETTAPGNVLSERAAQQIRDKLNAWGLHADGLQGEHRARILDLMIHRALALGDAAEAQRLLATLQTEFPEDRQTHEAAYLVACSAGDGQLGEEALKALGKLVDPSQRRSVARKRRWIRTVGERAPDVVIRTADMTDFHVRDRGDNVLVVDFWTLRSAADDQARAATIKLYEAIGNDRRVDFVGVNADSEDKIDEAKAFAERNGYVWKHRFEGVSRKAPITHNAFHAGSGPWMVVIDSYGYIRGVGSPATAEIHYAVRTALAEARGDKPRVLPRTRSGERPETLADKASASRGSQSGSSSAAAKPDQQLEDNAEAEAKLRRARVYLRQGVRGKAKALFQEIVSQYPGTIQAKKAREYLDGMP